MKWISRFFYAAREHGHHAIFGISIFSLALLVGWWSVFINQSIDKQEALHKKNLELKVKIAALEIQLKKTNLKEPRIGQAYHDGLFVISSCYEEKKWYSTSLSPRWPNLCIQVKENVIKSAERDFERKKIMVTGESAMLVFLIVLSSVLLYQFIQLGRKTMREIEEFWERVTHEIKTPITGVKAFFQSMKNQSIPLDQMNFYIDMALKQVEKQEQLAENILAGNRLRSFTTHHQPAMDDIDLKVFIKDYFELHVLHLTDTQLLLEIGCDSAVPPDIIRVKADSHWLKIILDNIVDNALKYCSPGLILKVKVMASNKKAVIAVRDNGSGLSPSQEGRIFRAFKYSKQELPHAGHGSGIGLFISRKLAQEMGGQLEASSTGLNQGTEFRLILKLLNPVS